MLYKAYWEDGGQIPYPHDEEIIDEVNKIEKFSQIKILSRQQAEKEGLFNIIGKEVDDEYIKNVKAQSINSDIIKKVADDLKIVYTPLHGAGNKPVRRILSEVGFNNVYVVEEQELPDENFSTVGYPNPEDPKAFELALKLAAKINADIVIGTDPDSDRMGAIVKKGDGEYFTLSGNMTGVLILHYILSQRKVKGTLPYDAAVVSTIVSTNMTKALAEDYGVRYFEVLTGFKYIGQKIKEFEEAGVIEFIFGFEESYGYLAGTYARDKDAIVASMLICEAAAYYKAQGMTLYEGLQKIYEEYGFYKEGVVNISLKGISGLENIKKIMSGLRENPPKQINGISVSQIKDCKTSICIDTKTKTKSEIELPKSDVLYYVLEDDSWFCVRPSGTEPKVKIYFGVKDENEQAATSKLKAIEIDVVTFVNKCYQE